MVNIQSVDILTRAREIITPEAQWTQKYYGRDASGCEVGGGSNEAICRCSSGALTRAGLELRATMRQQFGAIRALEAYVMGKGCTGIEDFNDSRSHADVLAGLDECIKGLEAARA